MEPLEDRRLLSLSLGFPLPNRTPDTVTINTAFDHSVPGGQYTANNVVVDYKGERGESQYGSAYVTTYNGVALYGFKNATGSVFTVNGHYSGGSYLYYDGHPGYDFRTTDQSADGKINVLAAAAGTVDITDPTTGHIRINHGGGYETNYYHLSEIDVSVNQAVTNGQKIGVSGDVGAPGSPHLHFSVTLSGIPVDPYGWQGSGSDPYAAATNVYLWGSSQLTTYSMPNPATVNEGAGTLNFTVTRSGGLPAETLYATTLQDQGYTNSSDYTGFVNQNLVFASNQTQATVTISITNDIAPESNETFSLIVQRNTSDPNTTYLVKSIFTIIDNDTATTDYPGAVWESGVPVGNYTQASRAASDIRWIVLHTTESTASSAVDWFRILPLG